MRKSTALLAMGAIALAPAAAFGAPPSSGSISPPVTTGQPNVSCQDINGGNTGPYYPGETSTAQGSAFNETGPGTAGTVYAGNQSGINDKNTVSVSQYDMACQQQFNRINR